MAIDNAEIQQMIAVAHSTNINVLVGALCVAGLNIVTEMTSDMLHDSDFCS